MSRNSKLRDRGVYRYRNEWHAVISADGQPLDLGVFVTPKEAWSTLMDEEWRPEGAYRYGDMWRCIYSRDEIIGEFETKDAATKAYFRHLFSGVVEKSY